MMFRDKCENNKYTRWYFSIIERAVKRNWTKDTAPCYVEMHHAVPESLGGIDKDLVCLTAREHFICHLLLPKMLSGKDRIKMIWALGHMATYGVYKIGRGRFYQRIREMYVKECLAGKPKTTEHREKISKAHMGHTRSVGNKNPMYGKRGELSPIFGKKQSDEHKEKRLSMIRGRKQSTESKLKMSQNRPKGPSGKKWFNNGVIETFDLPENKPADFVFGRLKRTA